MEQPKLSKKVRAKSLLETRRSLIIERNSDVIDINKDSVDISIKAVTKNSHAEHSNAAQVSSQSGGGGLSAVELNSVVKVFTSHCWPCYSRPWQMTSQRNSTGSAFVLPHRRLLTNAHVVDFSSVIRVQRRFEDAKYVAKILAIAEDCDLALLTVKDDKFWDDLSPLNFGHFPKLQEDVTVVGYPFGGENISITKGVVSRIDLRWYTPAHRFITIQIDAAINYGNSGGPVFNKSGQVVGVAFQKSTLGDSDGVGFIIGNNVVNRFLNDIENNGCYTGYSSEGFGWQPLMDNDFRRYLNMNENQSGVLVVDFESRSTAERVLKKGDIVMKIDGVDISNSGTVLHPSGERIFFHSIVSDKHVGDDLRLSILRDGNEMEINYSISGSNQALVPVLSDQKLPEYFIFGGFVFTVLTRPYMETEYGPDWGSSVSTDFEIVSDLTYDDDVDEIVILSHVLEMELNVHYADLDDERLVAVNGERVTSLKHLSRLVNDSTEEFLRFDFAPTVIAVLDRKKALLASEEISQRFQVSSLSRFNEPESIVTFKDKIDAIRPVSKLDNDCTLQPTK